MNFIGTIYSLVPGIIAILCALITKKVYLSLFISIISGCFLLTDFQIFDAFIKLFSLFKETLLNVDHLKILLFLLLLGIIVHLVTISGGSLAYGKYMTTKVKSKRGALFSTFLLGVVLFIDDYFNCLTVGNVMNSVTSKFHISKAKLAYIIDSTAAPICIIAPISSWAAAVSGYTDGDGFILFIQTIPYNLYAILTIVTVVFVIYFDLNFGTMKNSELKSTENIENNTKTNASIIDLVVPILFLIISTISIMLVTGGIIQHKSIIQAFIYCDASTSLVLACISTLLFILVFYIARKVISVDEFIKAVPKGAKTMFPAIKILLLAWTLGSIVSSHLQVGSYVVEMLNNYSIPITILPAVLFLLGIILSFSTGSSWSTFGILIPIVISIFSTSDIALVYNIAAILAGAVAGDHVSPISDTSIMASSGAKCDHLEHVHTQLPYALIPAFCSFVGYLLIGYTNNLFLSFTISFVLLLSILFYIKKRHC